LPRRYYLAATECTSTRLSLPSCLPYSRTILTETIHTLVDGSYPEQKSLNPVPSILDLPSLAEDAELSRSSPSALSTHPSLVNLRNRSTTSRQSSTDSQTSTNSSSFDKTLTLPPQKQVVNDGTASLPHLRTTTNSDGEPSTTGSATGTETPVHLDADVLTKIVVYAGIGLIATVTLPWLFGGMGLSVWKDPALVEKSHRWVGRSLIDRIAI
jgi:hypothetical protein